MFYSKSPHSWALPSEWQKICEKFPAIIRNKVTTSAATTHASTTIPTLSTATTTTSSNSVAFSPLTNASYSLSNPKASPLTLRVACNNAAAPPTCNNVMSPDTASPFSTTAITTFNTNVSTCTTNNGSLIKSLNSNSATFIHDKSITISTSSNYVTNIAPLTSNNNLSNNFNNINHSNSNNNHATYYNDSNNINTSKPLEVANNTIASYKLNSHHGSVSLNIRRKGFFNRLTYSIDEDAYEAAGKAASSNVDLTSALTPISTNAITHITPTVNSASLNVTAGSGRIHSAGLNRHIMNSVRPGAMASAPQAPLTNTDTRQKLLNKQMKIISDIMVKSGKNVTHKSNENLKSNFDQLSLKLPTPNDCGAAAAKDNDDDSEVEIVTVLAGSNGATTSSSSSSTFVRPKLSHDFRSYSTCD